jgi:mRNA-degrading endonuclease toxin of MazEF toxin-antitoxin module
VLSPAAYSARTGFASVCPIEARARANGFAVELPRGSPAQGVLADRVTAVDVRQNRTGLLGSAPDEVVAAVLGRVAALLGEIPDT